MSKKNNKKNLKKVQAKIGTTPVKAEAAKKEESKALLHQASLLNLQLLYTLSRL